MTTKELRQLLLDNSATDAASMIDALEDGDALYRMGVTDADVLAVECLHAELMVEGDDEVQALAEQYLEEFGTLNLDDEWAGAAYTECFTRKESIEYPQFAEHLRIALRRLDPADMNDHFDFEEASQ